MSMDDLRHYPRVSVTRPVRIRLSSGAVVQARMVNISQGGAAVLYEVPAELGANLELTFSLVVRGREIQFHERCVARYNHLSSSGYIIGFQFVALDAEARENLREFVAIKRSMQDQ
ncbi:MAG: PilZ domain-containing protein [Gammaproteobacteria bacterium]|nr:PilZ domain-containing protein [Gammaproteobacteria bacterium]